MPPLPNSRTRTAAACGLFLTSIAFLAQGQDTAVEKKTETVPVDTLPEVIVSAPQLRQDLLTLPLSATVTSGDVIDQNGIRTVKDAAAYAPNTFFTEFTARKLSNPRFRGLGGSPNNPGVTTYYDGVPQFNGNSSSLELLDVEQIDFVRGPAGALFGRNTVGGLINVTSRRPSLDSFAGEFETTFGNYNLYDFRGRISTPLVKDQLGFSFAGGYNERDGFTENTVTGNDLDSRSAYFGKAQFLWTPSENLEVRFIIAGESARDGDYALNDLAQLRRNPRQSARDVEGYTERDVVQPTLQLTYHADAFDFTSTTGFVWWQTEDYTDLDYTAGFPIVPIPFLGDFQSNRTADSFLTRKNTEEQTTFTQEFRLSNPAGKPVTLSESIDLAWQAGVFFFYQDYEQQTVQNMAALDITGFGVIRPASVTRTFSDLRDYGFGSYLQGTLTFWEKLDLTLGVRWDYENKEADLRTTRTPIIPLAGLTDIDSAETGSRSFNQITPQAALSYRITPDLLTYFSFSGGYKAGGFNAGAPVGAEFYEEEKSWNYELGLKGRALNDKLNFGLALFYTDWQDLQLNVPNGGPATFHIANAGDASSKGIELNLHYRPTSFWELFGSAGWLDTTFHDGSFDNNAGALTSIAGKQLPYAPDYTTTIGTQFNWELGGGLNLYARADVQFIGSFNYDSVNGAAQSAYSLANFRLGVRHRNWFVEGFVNNAFDTEYVPMAFSYADLAPSGYVGESGAPATFGVRVGVKF